MIINYGNTVTSYILSVFTNAGRTGDQLFQCFIGQNSSGDKEFREYIDEFTLDIRETVFTHLFQEVSGCFDFAMGWLRCGIMVE